LKSKVAIPEKLLLKGLLLSSLLLQYKNTYAQSPLPGTGSSSMSAPLSSGTLNFDSAYLKEYTYEFSDTLKFMKHELFTTYKNQFGLGNDDEMIIEQNINADSTGPNIIGEGHYYSKYQLYHRGYKVEGAHMNVLGQYNVALRASGFLVKGLDVETTAPITEAAALAIALDTINASTYMWEDSTATAELKESLEDSLATFYPKGTLTILSIEDPYSASDYRLCWSFSIESFDPVGKTTVIIDAITGGIVKIHNPYFGADFVWGSVQTPYNGTRPIKTATCLLCTNYTLSGPPDKRTYGWYFKSSGMKAQAKDGNNNWTSSEDTRTTASAYWIADVTRDFYVNKHGRWGSDYNGKGIFVLGNRPYLNTSSAFNPLENDWDEIWISPDWYHGKSIAAIDIIAHEISHGYLKYHSNIGGVTTLLEQPFYYDAKTIREGLCDIFGQMTERTITGTTDWVFGSDLGVFKRFFENPHNDYPSPSANTYFDPLYWQYPSAGEAGMYRNSGILRKWFYQLSNRTPSPYGIGIDNAEQVTYLTSNWWSWHTINYPEFAAQNRAEVKYDYGACTKTYRAAIKSWHDVGLLTNISIWGDCASDFAVRANDVVNKAIFTSFKVRPEIEENENILPGGTFKYDVPSSWIAYQSGDDLIVTGFTSNDSRKVNITYTDPNNQLYYGSKIVHIVDSGMVVPMQAKVKLPNSQDIDSDKIETIAAPNPANNSINITLPQAVEQATYTLLDLQGRTMLSGKVTDRAFTIPLPKLQNGMYILRINSNTLNTVNKIEITQP
jgi:Zn-dependent metalloprotease